MPIKSVKMKISKNKNKHIFLMSQGSLDQKIWFLGQKVCSVARIQTDTNRQTDTKVNTEDTLSGFQEFFLQPTINDRSNMVCAHDTFERWRTLSFLFLIMFKYQHKDWLPRSEGVFL